MTKIIMASFGLILLSLGYTLAQEKTGYKVVGKTYLADTTQYAKGIDSATAMRMLRRQMLSRDSAGVLHPVSTYTFTYASRGVFSDAEGRPFVGTDYFSTQSEKGILPQIWLDILPSKLKAGDTIIIEQPKTYTGNKKKPEYNSPDIKIYLR